MKGIVQVAKLEDQVTRLYVTFTKFYPQILCLRSSIRFIAAGFSHRRRLYSTSAASRLLRLYIFFMYG
ncbi:hypothetical protein L1987_29067 [Smallanthus sonchifolius]|uniref:Uncharacterized protein n=1 Tax=Smallanthus sonchifolius TaxID=185202 RepID=A0ACB9I1M1_9ASTR|nr:hypothetical protein L1987_29067 [Smallanthus sonchifolius]